MKNTSVFIALTAVVMLMSSCGTSKKTTTEVVENGRYAGTYDSRLTEIGFGKSYSKSQAYRNALKDAQQNIAVRLYRVLSSVDTDFAQDTENGASLQSMGKRSERFVGVIDDKVVSIHNVSEPVFSKDASGVYECEVKVVMDNSLVADVAKALYSSMSDDDALRVKFEEQQFIKEYEKQMKEFRERNGR